MAQLAARQHGVVSYWQLMELGFSPAAVDRRVKVGRLHRVYRGVYAVGHSALGRDGRDMAAVLACGPGALLSHWSAAARWELLRPNGGPFVIARRRCVVKGIEVAVKGLHPSDCTKRDRIPMTTVPRTLLDLAAVADERLLRRAVNQADRRGWLNRRAVADLLERNRRRNGTKALTAVMAAVDPHTRRSRSDLEIAFLQLCSKYGIPRPVVNEEVAGYEVDMHWPGTRLIVELDSYEYHRTPAEFDADRRRDARLKVLGFEVLRVPDRWLSSDPAGVARTVKALLTR
jgi:very-short-patch-repair endonuclease